MINLTEKSSTSFTVRWTNVPIMLQRGKILFYHFTIYEEGTGVVHKTALINHQFWTFGNLKHYKNYNITITSENSKGFGPERWVHGKTNEDGNYCYAAFSLQPVDTKCHFVAFIDAS